MMYLTERTAIKHRLESIRREKEALREDIAILREEEKEYIRRLGELDDKQGDVVDAEAIIDKLADTAKELKALIPEVPAVDLIKAMEEKLNPGQVIIEEEEEASAPAENLAEKGKEQRYREARDRGEAPAKKEKKQRPNLSADAFIEYVKEGVKGRKEFKSIQAKNLAIDRGMPFMDSVQFGNRLHYAKKQLGVAFPFEKVGRGVYQWKDAFQEEGGIKNEETNASDEEEKEALLI